MPRQGIDPHYSGFYLERPQGNNIFSFEKRRNKRIYVPELVTGRPEDLQPGERVAFAEWEEGKEHACIGLKQFIRMDFNGIPVYIFDNHNHAFYFWYLELCAGTIETGAALLHVDQHSDMREPEKWLMPPLNRSAVFHYVNSILNVGNFIRPALKLGWFDTCFVVDGSKALGETYKPPFVLDLDMDFFAPELDFMDNDLKTRRIREWARQARMITVATSPFFMDQHKAIRLIHQIFAQ